MTVTVVVKDKYIEALSAFGDLQTVIDLALQRYTIEQITTKVIEDWTQRLEAVLLT